MSGAKYHRSDDKIYVAPTREEWERVKERLERLEMADKTLVHELGKTFYPADHERLEELEIAVKALKIPDSWQQGLEDRLEKLEREPQASAVLKYARERLEELEKIHKNTVNTINSDLILGRIEKLEAKTEHIMTIFNSIWSRFDVLEGRMAEITKKLGDAYVAPMDKEYTGWDAWLLQR